MLELLLVRHGRTRHNVANYMDTVPPGAPLDELGKEQARQLAERLASEPVVGVYASTAIRAQQTADAVAARLGLTAHILDGFHEVFVGDLEGTSGDGPLSRYEECARAWADGDRSRALPGGESAVDVATRFTRSLNDVLARHVEGLVVIVSHGGTIRIAASYLDPSVTSQMFIDGTLPNTGSVRLRPDNTGPDSARWRCVEWTGVTLPPLEAAG